MKRLHFLLMTVCALAACAARADEPATVNPGLRYATDAYPAFERGEKAIGGEKKDQLWFQFIRGPKMDNAKDQFAWAQACEADGSWAKARRAYDAIVRNWPTSPEAPKAQQRVAEILLNNELDYQEAIVEYCYLLDYYSLSADYDAVADEMYKAAEVMREEGKKILFFRFANTADVRRSYEATVVRAPGAKFVPQAMLTIAELRKEENELEKAVAVCENLRNLHPNVPEAATAVVREAGYRMDLLRKHSYNRDRVRDTIGFLKQALHGAVDADARAELEAGLAEAEAVLEDDAYQAAKQYDSRMRTVRSAVSAYENFLADYPAGAHAEKVAARLEVLREKLEKENEGK